MSGAEAVAVEEKSPGYHLVSAEVAGFASFLKLLRMARY